MTHCTCPKDGSRYCTYCTSLMRRAGLSVTPLARTAQDEGTLQTRLRAVATGAGYLYYHTYSSKRSDPGWPDTAICHPDGGPLFLWELKRQDVSAQPSSFQRRWLEALSKVTHVHASLYRPSDWETILTHLSRRGLPAE